MVKEKLPCPRADGSSCDPGCVVCHGRGIVRAWHLLVTAEWLPDANTSHLERPGALPPGVALLDGYRAPLIALRVERYGISEAMGAACEALRGPAGETPFVHRAW